MNTENRRLQPGDVIHLSTDRFRGFDEPKVGGTYSTAPDSTHAHLIPNDGEPDRWFDFRIDKIDGEDMLCTVLRIRY
ncbi:hypothetical protein C7446_2295 [Kushneria sinocarnis]|uniref:Uncharacterized protein n=1 Tax=Kushneria sinocarnis TaxID=595502 RepID=A0A420WVJ8_9GAMM|nr:hypothetical protein C7446_2295 [Kushneria sinocarnis]